MNCVSYPDSSEDKKSPLPYPRGERATRTLDGESSLYSRSISSSSKADGRTMHRIPSQLQILSCKHDGQVQRRASLNEVSGHLDQTCISTQHISTQWACYEKRCWALLVVQWGRIYLPTMSTQAQFLIQEDPTSHGATKPVPVTEPVPQSLGATVTKPKRATATEASAPSTVCEKALQGEAWSPPLETTPTK